MHFMDILRESRAHFSKMLESTELTAEVFAEDFCSILDDSGIILNESEEQQSEEFTCEDICRKFVDSR